MVIGQLSKHHSGGSHKRNCATLRRCSRNSRLGGSRKSLYTTFRSSGVRRLRVIVFSSARTWGGRAHATLVAEVLSCVFLTASPPPLVLFFSRIIRTLRKVYVVLQRLSVGRNQIANILEPSTCESKDIYLYIYIFCQTLQNILAKVRVPHS